MSYPILNTFKTCALTGLIVLFTGALWGNVHSASAETTMDSDIVMTIDTSRSFNDEAEMFNNFLNVFTAAYIATDGNLEIVNLDKNTICISAHNGSCAETTTSQNDDMPLEVEPKKAPVTILTAY